VFGADSTPTPIASRVEPIATRQRSLARAAAGTRVVRAHNFIAPTRATAEKASAARSASLPLTSVGALLRARSDNNEGSTNRTLHAILAAHWREGIVYETRRALRVGAHWADCGPSLSLSEAKQCRPA
jgi:hypothetical protein